MCFSQKTRKYNMWKSKKILSLLSGDTYYITDFRKETFKLIFEKIGNI